MRVLVLEGDHIGPEIVPATIAVLEAADRRFGLGLSFHQDVVGLRAHAAHGTTVPPSVLEAAKAADGIVLGPCSNTHNPPAEQGGLNVPATIRKALDLYVNLRPCRTRPGIPDARRGFDLVFARENTEGFYADRNMALGHGEFMPTEDVALSIRKITGTGSRRIARAAFALARERRRKVSVVNKKAVLKMTDGLFLREAYAVSKDFPDVEVEEVQVDAFASLLYRKPESFDVVLITNMFGDILSNAGAEMSGGLGIAGSLNHGDDHAAANASHGSAPDIAGLDQVNPTAMILSGAMLLDWIGAKHRKSPYREAAGAIQMAVDELLARPETRTSDLGGRLGTQAFARKVCEEVDRADPERRRAIAS